MTNTLTIDQALQQAVSHHTQDQLQEAEELYRAILQVQPEHPDANNNLGVLAVQMNQPAASLPYFKAAVEANPNQGQYWRSYIDALIQAGQMDVARKMLEQGRQRGLQGEALDALIARLEEGAQAVEQANTEAVKEMPPVPLPVLQNSKKKSKTQSANKSARYKEKKPRPQETNALMALLTEGRYPEAIPLAQAMTVRYPLHGFGWKVLGAMFKGMGRDTDALAPMQKAIALLPDDAEAHSNLGVTLHHTGRLEEAETSLRRALEINPDSAEDHSKLGNILNSLERLDEAEASYRRAIQIKPDFFAAHTILSGLLSEDRLEEAEAGLRRALEIKPDYIVAHNDLGNLLKDMGRHDEAELSYRQALKIKPDYLLGYSNLLFFLDYHPDRSAAEIYLAYQEYDQRHGIPLRSVWCGHNNDRSPDRRLRIGYVSPDFRFHVCRLYVEPLLAHHDKTQVEVYAYAELVKEDAVSASYKNYVEHWIPTKGMSDEALAERIRSDGIDILVDLAGHTASNRLQVFARKPAPVSLSWIIGSGNTTGLSAIDYLLADEALIPIGSEGLFAEQPWRIATSAYCYRPNEGMGDVNALPAQQRGYITFGVLTRQVRINHHTVRVWSELLKAVPNARLLICSSSFKDALMQERLASRFAEHGIARSRLEIGLDYFNPWDALRGIDISLDTFPNNTGTSLLVSLYMGVPFITLAARPSLGRFGVHNLQCVGHPELIAWSEEEYIAKAVALANDLGRLAAYRASLRSEMELSPLLDEIGFARRVEEAYRSMWKIWCEKSDKI